MIRVSAAVRGAAVRRNLPAVRRVAPGGFRPRPRVTCCSLPGHGLFFTCCQWKASKVPTTLSMPPMHQEYQ
ncbi:hypothetical protein ABT063_25485 [Streptomyces sp. NPDC002838]|uniref:hypothetical protein n=1 Tax=Streptomyces sp. NPDC002838 TaxID=3154436 RepID=UPI0033169A9D